MGPLKYYLLIIIICISVSMELASKEIKHSKIIKQILNDVTEATKNRVIRKKTLFENKINKPFKLIQKCDKKWKNTFSVTSYIKSFLYNDCSKYLKIIQDRYPTFIKEIFVTDNQGALVCLTKKTTDYWQGDEDKWTGCMKQKINTPYITKKLFDTSTHSFLKHYNLPTYHNGIPAGRIYVGIKEAK